MPTIIDIPTEILIKIFGYLDYWDLKLAIPSVCKWFYFLLSDNIASTPMDKVLFRDKFKSVPKNFLTYRPYLAMETHPALDMLQYLPKGSIFDFYFGDSREEPPKDKLPASTPRGRRRLMDYAHVGRENAISPAVTKIHLHAYGYGSLGVVKGTGKGGSVTVYDIINRILKRYQNLKYSDPSCWCCGPSPTGTERYKGVEGLWPCTHGVAKLLIGLKYHRTLADIRNERKAFDSFYETIMSL